jgi:SAM-dependent methyltransferase
MAAPQPSENLFNRVQYKTSKQKTNPFWLEYGFLYQEAEESLVDKAASFDHAFERALLYGYSTLTSTQLNAVSLIRADIVLPEFQGEDDGVERCMAYDEESVPFTEELNLIASNLSMHFLNNFPGALQQALKALRPGGVFLATILGEETLHELKTACLHADSEYYGGMRRRIAPAIDIKTAAMLAQKAGFEEVVSDVARLTVHYPEVQDLLRDLVGMAQDSYILDRVDIIPGKEKYLEALNIQYHERFGKNEQIPATFDIITITGRKPGR